MPSRKLLTAIAVATTLDPDDSLPTTVVQGPSGADVVLVAGGDTMLAKGNGDPSAVEGRAGLADLAGRRRASYVDLSSDMNLAELMFAELRRRRVLG